MNIIELHAEIENILSDIDLAEDGEHLWEQYQKISAYLLRLNQIHNDLAWLEILGQASAEQKKFRTMIVDKTIESLEKLALFASRKITAKKVEWEMER